MLKKLCYFSLILIFASICTANSIDPDLLGWWRLDEGSGNTVIDLTASGNDGTIENDDSGGLGTDHSVWVNDSERGMVLSFDGDDSDGAYVTFTEKLPKMTLTNGFTWAFWAKQYDEDGDASSHDIIVGNRFGGPSNAQWIKFTPARAEFVNEGHVGTLDYTDVIGGAWIHMVIVKDKNQITHYRNGEVAGRSTLTNSIDNLPLYFAGAEQGERWAGYLSDVYLYQRALTQSEILLLMDGLKPELPTSPSPVDGEGNVLRDLSLSWRPGLFAVKHHVYLGDDFNEVSVAELSSPLIVGSSLDVNSLELPRLEFSKTYYWRVDEVDSEEEVTKGHVWSFTVEPKSLKVSDITASASSWLEGSGPENMANGSGMDIDDVHGMAVSDMWQSEDGATGPCWVEFAFDRIYKLDEVLVWNFNSSLEFLFGYGVKDVRIEVSRDGTTWDSLGDVEIPQGTSSGDCPATLIDLKGALAQYVRFNIHSSWGGGDIYGLSEVRFMYIPTWSRDPRPEKGSRDIPTEVTLSWRSGRDAAMHNVYLGLDESTVEDGTASMETVSQPDYTLSGLDLGTPYYWRVDAVNDIEPMSSWIGPVWSFTTIDYLPIDDFEVYDDDDEGGNRVFDLWQDGYEDDGNGSQVGYNNTPYCEKRHVHRGDQAMPMYYGRHDAKDSECYLPISDLKDWKSNGITSLVIYFRGELDNETGDLYAKINSSRVDYARSAEDLVKDMYIQWTIDLSEVNTDLSSVTNLSLGVENSGEGLLYIDDIRLYRQTPLAYSDEMWIEAEQATQIITPMEVNSVEGASGGQFIEVVGDSSGDRPPIDDMNTEDDESDDQVDGVSMFTLWLEPGVYQVNAKAFCLSGTANSFWVRFLGTSTDEANYWEDDNEGSIHYEELTDWIEWELPVTEDWAIAPLTSMANDGAIVHFQVETADYYNLEIAFREEGAQLDALMITQTLD